MSNPMEWVRPTSIDLIGPRAALFTIDLEFNSHLRNDEVVYEAMELYMERLPGIEGYRAEVRGNFLYLVVYGNINMDAVIIHSS